MTPGRLGYGHAVRNIRVAGCAPSAYERSSWADRGQGQSDYVTLHLLTSGDTVRSAGGHGLPYIYLYFYDGL